jgi:hypothetical protein
MAQSGAEWEGGGAPEQAVQEFLCCAAGALGASTDALPDKALALAHVAYAAQDAGLLDDADEMLAECHISPELVRGGNCGGGFPISTMRV